MAIFADFTFNDFLFNVFCNLVSFVVLTFILIFLFRPKIKISPYITGIKTDTAKRFHFKIINPTLFSFRNVKISLNSIHHHSYSDDFGNGFQISKQSIKTSINTITILSRRFFFRFKGQIENAIQISVDYDLEQILEDPDFVLELSVELEHPLNLSSVQRRFFITTFDRNCLKMGHYFINGNSLETKLTATK